MIIFSTLVTNSFFGPGAASFRYSGLFLEILGIGTVAVGISKKPSVVGQPSLKTRVIDWLRQLRAVFWTVEPINIEISAETSAIKMDAQAHITRSIPKDGPIQEVLEAITRNIDLIHDRITSVHKDVKTKIGKSAQEVRAEISEVRKATERLSNQIKQIFIGDIAVESVGLVWILCGVTLATIPDELYRFFY